MRMMKSGRSWRAAGVGRWALVVGAGFLGTGVLAAAQLGHAAEPPAGAGEARQAQEAFVWRGGMPAGGVLEIKGVNGSVHAEPSSGSEVVVTATMRGRRSDPTSVRVERVEHPGGITFCAVYPTPDGADEENSCAPGEGGRMSTHRNDVVVDFRVEVPAGVPFHSRTVNGGVEALGLESDAFVTTVNGSIELATTRTAVARSVNGSLDILMGAGPTENVEFETVNGRITLDVPDDLDARVEAYWLNGGMDTDLPMTVESMRRGQASGTFGRGGPTIRLKTVNGSIRIR